MKKLQRFSVSIIGCGDIGFGFDREKKINGAHTHFNAFRKNKNFEIISVAELNASVRKTITKEFGIPSFENYQEMLDTETADVIVVSSSDESHFRILKDLLRYNPKFVFCEKPLATNRENVEELVLKFSDSDIPLMVNFTRRFMDEFSEIKEAIEKRKLGEIQSMTFYYSRGLTHNASHYLDLINWYIGETEKNLFKISSRDGFGKDDDTVSFDLIYDGGLEVRFIGLDCGKLSFAEIDIVGTRGRVKINYNNEIEYFSVIPNKNFAGYSSYKLDVKKKLRFEKALPNAVENIHRHLKARHPLKSPASNSLEIFELINRIKSKSYA